MVYEPVQDIFLEMEIKEDMTEKALRYNTGKLRYELMPVEFEEELVKVFTKGAAKYADDNWKKSIGTLDHCLFMKDRLASARRHMAQIQKGEIVDEEVVKGAEEIETYHAAHAAWNLLAYLYYQLNDPLS